MKKIAATLFFVAGLTGTKCFSMNKLFSCCSNAQRRLFHSVTDNGDTRVFEVKYSTFLLSILFNEFINHLNQQTAQKIVLKFFTKNYKLTITIPEESLGKFIDLFPIVRKKIIDRTWFSMEFDCITDLLVATKLFVFSRLEYWLASDEWDGEITVKLIAPYKKNTVVPSPITLSDIPKRTFPKKKRLPPIRSQLKQLKSTANLLIAEGSQSAPSSPKGRELRRTKSSLK